MSFSVAYPLLPHKTNYFQMTELSFSILYVLLAFIDYYILKKSWIVLCLFIQYDVWLDSSFTFNVFLLLKIFILLTLLMNTLLLYLDVSFRGHLQRIRNRFLNTLLDCLNLCASHTAKLNWGGNFFCQILGMLLFQVSRFFVAQKCSRSVGLWRF